MLLTADDPFMRPDTISVYESRALHARRTSACPVRSNIASLEHWPYAIDVIPFGDFTPLAPGERGVCR